MFLFGVEFVFASYAITRIHEKRQKNKTKNSETPSDDHHDLNNHDDSFKDKNSRNLHYMKASGITMGLSGLSAASPIFLPLMLAGFTYTAIPYLRLVEESLLKKKKIDGYVLYGIADLMTLGLGNLITASFAVGLVHTGKFVISNAEKNSKESLVNIFEEQPNDVWILRDGVEIEIPLESVKQGDVVVVNTGDVIPVDGHIIEGIAAIDQHTLTGESQPAEKSVGDTVFAATQLMSGRLHVEVTTSGDETTVAKISKILSHAIDFKTNSQLMGEKWADQWNIPVLALGLASVPWLGAAGMVVILNGHVAQNIRIVAPLSTLNYLNIASHQGILIKDGRVLEDLPTIDTFLFDKTGTLTEEEPIVGRIVVYLDDYNERDLLTYAAAAECKLKHPIARAILKKANDDAIMVPNVDDSNYAIGYGVEVRIGGKLVQVGSHRFMSKEGVSLPKTLQEDMRESYEAGHSLIMVAIDQQFAGVIEMHAAVRPEVVALLANLRQHGVKHLAIVSGDHREPTQKLAKTLGMDDCFYDVLPQNKAEIVEKLQAEGRKVCFVGDGVNDTIAMKKANISISMSGATSVATDTAQIVLMDGTLSHLNALMKISFDLNKNLQKGWVYNIIPGTITILSAFIFHIHILTAILLSQSGLSAGIVNAMLPLRKITRSNKKKNEQ
ncbi:MAG: heavy metal translocating P-type ATPase [Mariprofundaceae bacterium]|nr:heavy metal translocating P-type ATPase [Mariprofundaceae bacterium]